MSTSIEAKRLSGIDRGKHVSVTAPGLPHTGPWELAGELISSHHLSDGSVSLTVFSAAGPKHCGNLLGDALVTITGIAP